MLGYEVGVRLVELNTWITVRLRRMAKLKTKLEVCYTVMYVQVKGGLARSSGPNLHNFMEAAEEECLLSEVEGGGGEVVHLVKTRLCLLPEQSWQDFISKMADKILQLRTLAASSS